MQSVSVAGGVEDAQVVFLDGGDTPPADLRRAWARARPRPRRSWWPRAGVALRVATGLPSAASVPLSSPLPSLGARRGWSSRRSRQRRSRRRARRTCCLSRSCRPRPQRASRAWRSPQHALESRVPSSFTVKMRGLGAGVGVLLHDGVALLVEDGVAVIVIARVSAPRWARLLLRRRSR